MRLIAKVKNCDQFVTNENTKLTTQWQPEFYSWQRSSCKSMLEKRNVSQYFSQCFRLHSNDDRSREGIRLSIETSLKLHVFVCRCEADPDCISTCFSSRAQILSSSF